MFKAATKSIANRYHIDARNDIYKVVGFHLFIATGLFSGLVLFAWDLIGNPTNVCLPGDISVVILFGVALYGLRQISYRWAVRDRKSVV